MEVDENGMLVIDEEISVKYNEGSSMYTNPPNNLQSSQLTFPNIPLNIIRLI